MKSKIFWVLLWCWASLTFVFPQTGSVSGTVYRYGCPGPVGESGGALSEPGTGPAPAEGVGIWLGDDFYTETDRHGFYTFADVPVGMYRLGAYIESYGAARTTVTVRSGERTTADLTILDIDLTSMRVEFFERVPRKVIDALNEAYGCTIIREYTIFPNTYDIGIPEGGFVEDFIEAYNREWIVRQALPNQIYCLH